MTRLCLEAMEASTVVLRTPPSVTPGALGRARIRAFVEARRAETLPAPQATDPEGPAKEALPGEGAGIQVVWEPEGLWEPPVAAAFAREAGVSLLLPAFAGGRALRNEDGDGLVVPGAWLRVDGSGPRQAIHGGVVDDLLEHAETAEHTVLVFAGPRAHANLGLVADALGLG